jgi:hypothetical protein
MADRALADAAAPNLCSATMLEYELPDVTAVRHVREHVLWLRFSDGTEGEVDLSDGLRAPPHFHATYGDYQVSVRIHDSVATGRFPTRALRLVVEWSELHRDELLENWSRLRHGEAPESIPPLS